MPEQVNEKLQRFIAEQDADRRRRIQGSLGEPFLTCARCGWQVAESVARLRNVRACERCGSRDCHVTSLPYNPERILGRETPRANAT